MSDPVVRPTETPAPCRVMEAVACLNDATTRHQAAGVWVGFSGGDDSLTAALVTSQAALFRGCLHLDTGIGVQETQEFVRETCKRQGWPLLIYRAKDCGQDYDALCVKYGFPGPGAHFRMYSRLKERPLRQFVRAHKRHHRDRIILSTGARSKESKRRMGHVQPERRDGCVVWMNPLHDWSKQDCLDYITERHAKHNPVVETLGMSGECLCGSFAHPNELDEITNAYPAVGERLMALEDRVKAAGLSACEWGKQPRRTQTVSKRKVSELCQSCELAPLFGDYSG